MMKVQEEPIEALQKLIVHLLRTTKPWSEQMLRDLAFNKLADQGTARIALALAIKRMVNRGDMTLVSPNPGVWMASPNPGVWMAQVSQRQEP